MVIRYEDGSFYEGPYVGEEWLSITGEVHPLGRAKNHYGVFCMPDGSMFEGSNIDNHFDPANIQFNCQLTLKNGEVYNGMFADEEFHGVGVYTSKDGTVYEGEWHKGCRFGHGQLRSSEGWTYEGFFDTDRRHRSGAISWPDGSYYIGDWYFDSITGKGLFISTLRDLYKGDMVDGVFHGYGDMFYTSGARYIGAFKQGMKHGKGIYTDIFGNEFFGMYENDQMHGEVSNFFLHSYLTSHFGISFVFTGCCQVYHQH